MVTLKTNTPTIRYRAKRTQRRFRLLPALILAASFLIQSPALALSSTISAPFDTGSVWYVCQGYNGSISHTGSDSLALDFTKQLCDGGQLSNTSSAGANVRSPLSGTVYWYGAAYGSLCVNTIDNRSIMLTHIASPLKAGDIVAQNQVVGAIGNAGTVGNGGIAHLHLQAWSSPGCATNPVPFDSIHSAQLCGAPDMTVIGPNAYNNGTWSGTSFITQTCGGASAPIYRLYSPVTKHHLFTSDTNEALTLKQSGNWGYEGVSFVVKSISGCQPGESVYRFYSAALRTHLYTNDENEKNTIISWNQPDLWSYEGVSFCASPTQVANTLPVYRFYSASLKSHLYTIDENEKNTIIATFATDVWKYEGVAYYAQQN